MHLAHELVEMDAALPAVPRHLEEGIHQQRLAAPHPAPDVHAARGLAARAEVRHESVQPALPVLPVILELLEELLQASEDLQLLAVGLEVAALREVPVPLERTGEFGRVLILVVCFV